MDRSKTLRVWLMNWHLGTVEKFFPNRELTPIPSTCSYELYVEGSQGLMELIAECPNQKAIVTMKPNDEYDVAVYFTESHNFGQR